MRVKSRWGRDGELAIKAGGNSCTAKICWVKVISAVVSTSTASPFSTHGWYFHCLTTSTAAGTSSGGPLTPSALYTLPSLSMVIFITRCCAAITGLRDLKPATSQRHIVRGTPPRTLFLNNSLHKCRNNGGGYNTGVSAATTSPVSSETSAQPRP